MKRLALLNLVSAGTLLCQLPLRAQIPRAGGIPGQGPTTPSTFPGQIPGPGANGSNTPTVTRLGHRRIFHPKSTTASSHATPRSRA
jgi:hypothetical protein